MADGIYINRGGHLTWLKWHRARKAAGDVPFTPERVLEGLRLGASVEVDLVRHADDGFAVLHDFQLDGDTTGSGAVRDAHADDLRRLFLRDAGGQASAHHPLLLEDLCALVTADGAVAPVSPSACVQLDLKEGRAALDASVAAAFARVMTPVARHFILSGGDAAAVTLLADAVPELSVGFDPCSPKAIEELLRGRDFAGFVEDALSAFPSARMIYLEHRLVTFAMDNGFDLVDAFHDAGKRVDAYTLASGEAAELAIAERLLAAKVDQITTDDPVSLEAHLGH